MVEVFTSNTIHKKKGYRGGIMKVGWDIQIGEIRYIRADLMCGECRVMQGAELSQWCDTAMAMVVKNRPACMAFEPQEG